MKTLFTFIIYIVFYTNSFAGIWNLLHSNKNSIDLNKVFHNSEFYNVEVEEFSNSATVNLINTASNEAAVSVTFHFNETNICDKIVMEYLCEECFHSHWGQNIAELTQKYSDTSLTCDENEDNTKEVKTYSSIETGTPRYFIEIIGNDTLTYNDDEKEGEIRYCIR